MGYHTLTKYDDTLSRFDTTPERDRQTDGRTDGQKNCINIARQRQHQNVHNHALLHTRNKKQGTKFYGNVSRI